MKLVAILVPLATSLAYVALHPGVKLAQPRLADQSSTAVVPTGDYTVDPQHGSIGFEITHLELSHVQGRFNTFSGKIHEDAKDLSKSTVEFTAKSESIDTAVAPRDEHLRTADFFDVAKFPDLTFKSTKIAKTKGGYVVTGELTIKGTTKSIAIPFKHFGPRTLKGMGDQPTRIAIVADPLKIKRSDFGVGSTAPLPDGTIGASDEVVVRISLEAIQDR